MIVFTHATACSWLATLGWTASDSNAMLIGQHHAPFDSLQDEPGLRQAIVKFYSQLDAFTCLTETDEPPFASMLQRPAYGIPNIAPKADGLQPQDILKRPRIAVSISRFSHEKQIPSMVRMFMKARDKGSDWKLHIYGAGEEQPLIEKEIAAQNASDFVELKGITRDPLGVLSNARLNLNSSSFEGFGMTVLEAATVGTPSLAFRCSHGITELLQSLGSFSVEADDEVEYTKELANIFRDEEILKAASGRAQKGSLNYSPTAVINQWQSMITDIHKLRNES